MAISLNGAWNSFSVDCNTCGRVVGACSPTVCLKGLTYCAFFLKSGGIDTNILWPGGTAGRETHHRCHHVLVWPVPIGCLPSSCMLPSPQKTSAPSGIWAGTRFYGIWDASFLLLACMQTCTGSSCSSIQHPMDSWTNRPSGHNPGSSKWD